MSAETTVDSETTRAANDYAAAATTRRETAPLLARRRENLSRDDHLESDRYDFRREGDGHKIRRIVIEDTETGDDVTDRDITATEGAAPSTTSSIRLIEAEAEILAAGGSLENPHVPTNDAVLREAADLLRSRDLTPAWEVLDG